MIISSLSLGTTSLTDDIGYALLREFKHPLDVSVAEWLVVETVVLMSIPYRARVTEDVVSLGNARSELVLLCFGFGDR